MSVTNIINNEEITIVQGIGGLFFCEESWVKQSRKGTPSRKTLDTEELFTTRDENNDTECMRTELPDSLKPWNI